MDNNYLNTNDIIEWINKWSTNNPEPSKSDIEQFARALNEKMQKINYKVSGDATVIGYAGKLNDGGTGIFETVKNFTENSNGDYIFINNSADNILNNTDFQKALRTAVDDYYDTIMNGNWDGDTRSKYSFEGVLSLNDLVSDNFMKNNANGNVYLLIMDNARIDSTLNVTEIERLLAMDEVKTINGIEKSVLAKMSSTERFNFLKEQSVIDLMNAKIYIDTNGKELLSFEGTKFENDFHTDIHSDYIEVGRYAERVFISDSDLLSKYAFVEGCTDIETLDAVRIFDYLISKGKDVSEISLGEAGQAKLPFLNGDLTVYKELGIDTTIEGFLKSFGTDASQMKGILEITQKIPESTLQEYIAMAQIEALISSNSSMLPMLSQNPTFYAEYSKSLAELRSIWETLSPSVKNNAKLWTNLRNKYVTIPLENGNTLFNPSGMTDVIGKANKIKAVDKFLTKLGKVGKVIGPVFIALDGACTITDAVEYSVETGDTKGAVKEITGWASGLIAGLEGSSIAMQTVAPVAGYVATLAPPWGLIGAAAIELVAGVAGFFVGESIGECLNEVAWAVGDFLYDNFVEGNFAENWLTGWEMIQDYVGDKWNAWSTYWQNVGSNLYDKFNECKEYWTGVGELTYDTVCGWLSNFTDMDDMLAESMSIWSEFLSNADDELIALIDSGYYNVIIGTDGVDILDGEDGNDLILVGDADDKISGMNGDDLIYGGAGNDTLNGGEDNDELFGEAGNDTLNGDAGTDKLFGDDGNDTLNGGADDDELFGGEGDDTLHGDDGNDYIEGGNGDNYLYGDAGDDTIVTGEDTDHAFGGSGNDYVIGGNGANYMYGEDGDDRLQGGEGYDYMKGGLGVDNLSGGNGYNEMYGQEGNDFIYGGDHADYIDGGVGDDQLYGANATDGQNEIYGREGNDIIYDGDQGAYIEGNEGDDTIRAGGGNDIIDGGTGNDYIQDDHGDDTVVFKAGYGTDTISDAAGNNTLSLSGLSIENATAYKEGNDLKLAFDTGDNLIIKQYFDGAAFQNFSVDGVLLGNLINGYNGTENDDWMSAPNTNNTTLYGNGGNDTLNGGDNADTLDGGEGTDYLYGGNGDDTYIFGKGYGSDTIEDWNGSSIVKLTDINIDEVSISNANDSALVLTVDGTGDTLTINGYKWNQGGYTFEFADGTTDTVDKDAWTWESELGSSSDDTTGDSGTGDTTTDTPNTDDETTQPDVDTTEEYTVNGMANAEWLNAPNNNSGVIDAGGGDDGLNGGSGSDRLYGGAGNDNLYGNDGDDVLDGGADADSLNGGNGTDTYIFAKGYGNDTVNEWSNDVTVIKLTDIRSDEITLNSQSENNLVISINGTSDTLTISNYRWSQGSFTFEFADGAVATVIKETWELEYSQNPTVVMEETSAEASEDEIAQANAELLTELYAEDTLSTELISETDNTIISNVTESTTVSDETNEVSDQTDLQVMVLTENMSAFADEENISDGTNITDVMTEDTTSQLLVNSVI